MLDADIKGFFDNLPHKVIMAAVCLRVADGNVLGIKVREITTRSRNFDETVINTPNQVIRDTANYFAQPYATCRWLFQKSDSWIRMQLRAMKKKRKNDDNRQISVRYFSQKRWLLTLKQFCTYKDEYGETRRVAPRNVAT